MRLYQDGLTRLAVVHLIAHTLKRAVPANGLELLISDEELALVQHPSGNLVQHPSGKVDIVFYVPATNVEDFEVLGTESRLTVTRILLLGLAGLGSKRNRTIIRFADHNGLGATVETAVEERAVLGLVRQFDWVRQILDRIPTSSQSALARDTAAQILNLAELKRTGALSDEEFQTMKARLLRQLDQ